MGIPVLSSQLLAELLTAATWDIPCAQRTLPDTVGSFCKPHRQVGLADTLRVGRYSCRSNRRVLQFGMLMRHQLFRWAFLGYARLRNSVAMVAMLFDGGVPVAGAIVSDGAAINMSSGRRVSAACLTGSAKIRTSKLLDALM